MLCQALELAPANASLCIECGACAYSVVSFLCRQMKMRKALELTSDTVAEYRRKKVKSQKNVFWSSLQSISRRRPLLYFQSADISKRNLQTVYISVLHKLCYRFSQLTVGAKIDHWEGPVKRCIILMCVMLIFDATFNACRFRWNTSTWQRSATRKLFAVRMRATEMMNSGSVITCSARYMHRMHSYGKAHWRAHQCTRLCSTVVHANVSDSSKNYAITFLQHYFTLI